MAHVPWFVYLGLFGVADGFLRAQRTFSKSASKLFVVADGSSTAARHLERFFFDQCDIFVKGGQGGLGSLSSNGVRPAGGCGGRGGNVVLECTFGLATLSDVPGKKYAAQNGGDARRRESGANAQDLVIKIPPNCIVRDLGTNETLVTLVYPGERYTVVHGGEGGKGNGASGKLDKTSPPGPAAKKWISLQMTLVADVGLIGFPNAGKSTLLSAVSKARPKVADYPFTTLVPNLGVCEMERFQLDNTMGMVWLDIPGLIKGASSGKGLGLAFLRHAERCRMLIHLVSGESANPSEDLISTNSELKKYSPELAAMPQVVVLTKADLMPGDLDEKLEAMRAAAGHTRVIEISSADGTNIKNLLQGTHRYLAHLEKKVARS